MQPAGSEIINMGWEIITAPAHEYEMQNQTDYEKVYAIYCIKKEILASKPTLTLLCLRRNMKHQHGSETKHVTKHMYFISESGPRKIL